MGTTLGGGAEDLMRRAIGLLAALLGSTLGGWVTTLGGGTGTRATGILGWSSTKVVRGCLERTLQMERAGGDRFADGALGTGTVGEGAGGGVAGVLGIQLVNRLQSFEMVVSCS